MLRAVLDRLDGSVEPRDLALAGWLIGAGLGLSLGLLTSGAGGAVLRPLWLYGVLLALFHSLEFGTTAVFHPNSLSFDSSLLNHSTAYLLAHISAVVEFLVEAVALMDVPWRSSSLRSVLLVFGLGVTLAGQTFRTLAMWDAGRNFTHVIATVKEDRHVLVTNGVYGCVRHPSYLGFFLWVIGTQVVLANPICAVAFLICIWKYFAQRVRYEEQLLVRFFGDDYRRYQAQVRRTGIPFVTASNYD